MRAFERRWIAGLIAILLLIGVPVWYFAGASEVVRDMPWKAMPGRPAHVDHKDLFSGEFGTGPEVTAACLECHEEAGEQVLHTAHWRWQSEPVQLEGREEPVATGKKNTINNFCIGIQGNWESCTACHAGYGWKDENFDFDNQANIDCLACHDNSGTYAKGPMGLPVEGVDLLVAAQSVGVPTRENCGGCHFRGGGGNAVKHGDLDESLYYPTGDVDVHMGRYDFLCVDCHQTRDHVIGGRSISVSVDNRNQISCTDCHNPKLHADSRINAHTDTVACQTCHIPEVAVRQATKTHWDWSTAGDDSREEDVHHYLKIKGSFAYQKNLRPEYRWYNGLADRYLLGDKITTNGSTPLNPPKGDIRDPQARIWPFKIHLARQPYDTQLLHLLQPVTSGEDGFWTHFEWDDALRMGAEITGTGYSGSYDFAATEMFWPQTHMVAPRERALQCQACHAENGRMDWDALGYAGDPIKQGGQGRMRATGGSTSPGPANEE
jgi:octaheme c-type cytochrome (tetrathionate reductase family)